MVLSFFVSVEECSEAHILICIKFSIESYVPLQLTLNHKKSSSVLIQSSVACIAISNQLSLIEKQKTKWCKMLQSQRKNYIFAVMTSVNCVETIVLCPFIWQYVL